MSLMNPSFLTLMAGSGLITCLKPAFSPNAVSHMLTGKVFERAMRALVFRNSSVHIEVREVFN